MFPAFQYNIEKKKLKTLHFLNCIKRIFIVGAQMWDIRINYIHTVNPSP